MKLAGVADGVADILDGKLRQLQKLCGLGHPVADQEFLRAFADGVAEDLAEVAAV